MFSWDIVLIFCILLSDLYFYEILISLAFVYIFSLIFLFFHDFFYNLNFYLFLVFCFFDFFLENLYFLFFFLIFLQLCNYFSFNVFWCFFLFFRRYLWILFSADHLPIYVYWTWWAYVPARHLKFSIWFDRFSSLGMSTIYW